MKSILLILAFVCLTLSGQAQPVVGGGLSFGACHVLVQSGHTERENSRAGQLENRSTRVPGDDCRVACARFVKEAFSVWTTTLKRFFPKRQCRV
jgi:hypothetical protein